MGSPDYCLLWLPQLLCMPRSDWAAWVQAVGSIAAIFGATAVAIWQAHKQHQNSLKLVRIEQQHFAYAVFVQVAEQSFRFEHMNRKLAELGPQIAPPSEAKSDEFQPTDFWCALVGEELRTSLDVGGLLSSPMLDGMSTLLSTTLSSIRIQGREFAALPREVIAAHHRASHALNGATQALDSVVSTIKTDRTKLRDDMIQLTWSEMQRMGKSLIDLREELRAVAFVSTAEAEDIERVAVQTSEREQAEVARRAQAMPAASAAVKRLLARRAASSPRS